MTEKNDYRIRAEGTDDYRKVENLVREAFWNVYRPGCYEHYVLHRYRGREDFVPQLDLVLEKDGDIIGHIMYVHGKIQADDGSEIPVMTFGPLSIHPDWQRRGFGKALVDFSLEKAGEMGAKVVCIEGDIGFYGKSGFVAAVERGIRYGDDPEGADAPYFLIKELKEGFLENVTGNYSAPDGYFVDEEEVARFDAGFPKKEKLRLPGQLE